MAFKPKDFTVWAEIPVADLDRAVAFYNAVFEIDLEIDESGPNPMAMFPVEDLKTGVGGHLYPGRPAVDGAGPTVHFAVPGRLEDAIARVAPAGGRVMSEPIALPDAGRFAYCLDTEGNSIGLFSSEPAKA